MRRFDFFIPTHVKFGVGRLAEVGDLAAGIGSRCLLVVGPMSNPLVTIRETIVQALQEKGVTPFIFDGVVANPTMESIEHGMDAAMEHKVDLVVAVGGGSSIDSAKTIALLYSTKGTIDWQSVCAQYTDPFGSYRTPAGWSLPLIAIPTTAGTGSHVTQAAVVTDGKKNQKITIFHPRNFPLVSIVDPALSVTMPSRVTATTGFDAFTHAFESFLGNRLSPFMEAMALKALDMIFYNLPKAMANPADIQFRTNMAWADTLAGMCLANGGATIPHPLAEIIGGVCPQIAHGEALAMIYPEFLRFNLAQAPLKYAQVTRAIKPEMNKLTDMEAAKACCDEIDSFLNEIGLCISLNTPRISAAEYEKIGASEILDHIGLAVRPVFLKLFHSSRTRKFHELS